MIVKIGAVFMALLVLFSSTAFLKSTHYCAGEIADVSYFVSSDTCGSMLEEICDVSSERSSVEKKSCCSTDAEIVQGQDFFENSITISLIKITSDFLFDRSEEVSNVSNLVFSNRNFYLGYRPPLVFHDFNILYDTFLI